MPPSLQRAKEFFEEVGRDGGAIFGRAADVVDGTGFGEDRGAGGGERGGDYGLVEEGLFGCGEPGGVFTEAGSAEADVLNHAILALGN